MTKKKSKKRKKVSPEENSKFKCPVPQLPEEPPKLDVVCLNCRKKSSLKVYVIIDGDDWLPPHNFETFCTAKCAKEWHQPCSSEQTKPKIVLYKKWPGRKELTDGKQDYS